MLNNFIFFVCNSKTQLRKTNLLVFFYRVLDDCRKFLTSFSHKKKFHLDSPFSYYIPGNTYFQTMSVCLHFQPPSFVKTEI